MASVFLYPFVAKKNLFSRLLRNDANFRNLYALCSWMNWLFLLLFGYMCFSNCVNAQKQNVHRSEHWRLNEMGSIIPVLCMLCDERQLVRINWIDVGVECD